MFLLLSVPNAISFSSKGSLGFDLNRETVTRIRNFARHSIQQSIEDMSEERRENITRTLVYFIPSSPNYTEDSASKVDFLFFFFFVRERRRPINPLKQTGAIYIHVGVDCRPLIGVQCTHTDWCIDYTHTHMYDGLMAAGVSGASWRVKPTQQQIGFRPG